MYMSKEVLMERAVNKLKEIAEKDLNAMTPREKALNVIELEKLHNRLIPFGVGSELAGAIANDCMEMKRKLIESDFKKVSNSRERRAKVIIQGMENTPYDIPWLRQ